MIALAWPFTEGTPGEIVSDVIALFACLIVGFNIAMIRHIGHFVRVHDPRDSHFWQLILGGKTFIAIFLAFDLLAESEVIPAELALAGIGVTVTFLGLALLYFRKDNHA